MVLDIGQKRSEKMRTFIVGTNKKFLNWGATKVYDFSKAQAEAEDGDAIQLQPQTEIRVEGQYGLPFEIDKDITIIGDVSADNSITTTIQGAFTINNECKVTFENIHLKDSVEERAIISSTGGHISIRNCFIHNINNKLKELVEANFAYVDISSSTFSASNKEWGSLSFNHSTLTVKNTYFDNVKFFCKIQVIVAYLKLKFRV